MVIKNNTVLGSGTLRVETLRKTWKELHSAERSFFPDPETGWKRILLHIEPCKVDPDVYALVVLVDQVRMPR